MKNLRPAALVLALASLAAPFVSAPAVGAAKNPVTNVATSATGILRAVMATEATGDESPLQQYVVETDGGILPVPQTTAIEATPGSRVEFDGTTVETTVVDPTGVTAKGADSPTAAAAAPVYAPIPQRRLVVVPLAWTGWDFTSARATQLADTLTALDSRWSAGSGGIEDLEIRSLPITSITAPADCEQGVYTMEAATKAAVEAAGLTAWATNIAAIVPSSATSSFCWWGGLGYMPGSFVWINSITPKVFLHELGHNMGLPHANVCLASFTVSLVDKCKHYEYGDFLDPMGGGNADNSVFGPAYMRSIGWLPDTQWTTWTGATTTYSLVPTHVTTGGLRGVRIDARGSLMSDGPGEYWLQFSTPAGTASRAGVYLTLTPTKEHVSRGVDIPQIAGTGPGLFTWLCDISPTAYPDGAYAFTPGVPWLDPLGRFSVTVNSVGTTASVTVTPVGKVPSALSSTSATPEQDAQGQYTGTVKVSWTATRPLSSAATGEPVVVEATINGTTIGCSAVVMTGSCTINGSPRGRSLDVTLVPRNYAGTGAAVVHTVGVVPVTSPSGTLTVTAGGKSADVTLSKLDDGGSAVNSITPVTVSNGTSCTLIEGKCSISGLLPNTSYSLSLVLANSVGKRSLSADFTTSMQAPAMPTYSVEKTAEAFRITVTPGPIDLNNVSHVGYRCGNQNSPSTIVSLPWSSSLPPVQFELPLSTADWSCYAYAFNKMGGTGIGMLLNRSGTQGTNSGGWPDSADTGESTVHPVVDAKVVRSKNRTSIKVTWTVRDFRTLRPLDGYRETKVRKIGGKTCRMTSATSCVVKGLSSRKRYLVMVTAPGFDIWSTVVR